jgi:integrase
MSAALSAAAQAVTERLRTMAERPQALTVRELVERRLASYRGRDTTLIQRLPVWAELIGDFTLAALDADVVHAARAELAQLPALAFKGRDHEGDRIFKAKSRRQAKTPATINRYMAALSGMLTWAIAERLAPRGWSNPCRGIKRMPEPAGRVRFLTEDERTRLFEACRASGYPRLHALVLSAMLTGARLGELLALTWRDVDLERGRAQLGRSKNGDRRTLVLLPQVVEALRPFAGEASRYVFGSTRTRHATPAEISTAWRAAMARAAIADFRFHDLRHCCASYLAQAGVPLNMIKEILGHRKIDMTLRYAHLTVDTKAQAMLEALGSIGA